MAGSFNVHRCTYCGISPVEQKEQILVALCVKEKNSGPTPYFLEVLMPGAGICADCFEKVRAQLTPAKDLPEEHFCHCCGTPVREVQALFVGKMLSLCDGCLKVCGEIIEDERKRRQEKPKI